MEAGIITDEFSIVLEDDVMCADDGFERVMEFIPREVDDIERVMKKKRIGEVSLNQK